MDRLPLDAEQLLEQLRQLDDPTPEERQRADAGVRSRLAAHGVRNLPRPLAPILPSSPHACSAPVWKQLLLGSASVVVLLALGAWGTSAWRKNEGSRRADASRETMGAPVAPAAPRIQPELPPLAATQSPTSVPERAVSQRDHQAHQQEPRVHRAAKDDSLAEELRFVASVDADIRAGSYDRALRRLSKRNRPSSQVQEERSAMRVLALCGRDHDTAAARARDQFLKSAPSSLLAMRVQAACQDATP